VGDPHEATAAATGNVAAVPIAVPVGEQAVDPVDRPRRDAEPSIRCTRPPTLISRTVPGWSDMNRLLK
jgi:hypothetical protein